MSLNVRIHALGGLGVVDRDMAKTDLGIDLQSAEFCFDEHHWEGEPVIVWHGPRFGTELELVHRVHEWMVKRYGAAVVGTDHDERPKRPRQDGFIL